MAVAVPFTFPLEVLKQVEEAGAFHVVGYAATTDFDMQGDIITEEALQNASLDLVKNSTVLLNHDMTRPIGKVTKVDFDKHGLLIDALISETETELIQKIKEGVLNKFSIRGQVLEREKKYMKEYDRVVNVIKKIALVEVSLVSVPANPEARAIGWYLSKALEGETSMSDEKPVPEEVPAQVPEAPPAKEETVTVPETPLSAPEPEVPQPAAAVQKDAGGPWKVMLTPAFFLLEKLIALGGETASTAQQVKAILATLAESLPAITPHMPAATSKSIDPASAEDIGKMVAAEVKKQVDMALKSVPTVRKGLITQESETADLNKRIESLPLERKLRAALALQQ